MTRGRGAALAAAAVLVAAGACPAGAASRYEGYCGYDRLDDRVRNPYDDGGTWRAVLNVQMALLSDDPAGPASATVTCWLTGDGVPPDATLTVTGTGVVAGAKVVEYTVSEISGHPGWCWMVDFHDEPGVPTGWTCTSGPSVWCPDCEIVPPVLAEACAAAGVDEVYVDGAVEFDCTPDH